MSPSKSQVKLACLACRSYKTRCDGQQPCANCSSNQRECHYRPSRRGGARRGQRYQNAKRGCTGAVNNSPPVPSTSPETNDPFGGHLANSLHSFLSVQRRREIVNADIADDSNATTSHSAFDQPTESLFIRSYQDENDLVNAYYIFIHPYLPLLPPQNFPRLADNPKKVFMRCLEPNKSSLPFWPTSSFSLALMALLVLLPLPEDADPMQMAQVELRRSYADLYAREALESIEKSSNGQEHTSAAPISTLEMDKVPRSSIHPKLPCTLEPVLALLLLGVYEYCQNSNRRQMRSRVYGALILAMDLSLHIRDTNNSYNWDVQPRVWWMTMFLVYQAAIFNHSSPIILLDDPRITTPFPDFSGCQELWPKLMKAQEVMLKAGVLAKEMTEGKVKGSPESFRKSVCELDSLILTVISELNRPPECQPCEGADTAAVLNQWLMARFLAHTARIKLHRFRSFGDHPVFLDKFCDLSSINSSIMSHLPLAVSPGQFSESNSVFPFTEEQSTQICLKAALALSRTLRALPWPNPSIYETAGQLSMDSTFFSKRIHYPRSLPYMACCGMQGCYVLMMLLRKIRTCLYSNSLSSCRYLLGHTEPATEYQDAERFIEELRSGVKSVCDFMSGNAVFEGVMDMAREVETTYIAHFHE